MINKKIINILIFIISMKILISFSNGKKTNKIIGGQQVTIQSFPHQVSILYAKSHVCAGSIVSSYHIITTASCVSAENKNIIYGNLEILIGTDDRFDENGEIHQVSLIIFHEHYKGLENYWQNDLAILKLTKEIKFTNKQRPGRLAIRNLKCKKNELWISGWGGIPTLAGSLSRYLQGLQVRELSHERCQMYYEPFIPIGVLEGQACAAPEIPGPLITPGDGGNPLTAWDKIIGMVSINIPTLKNPVLYTRIYFYHQFIHHIIVNY